jgi:hypothetical protein
MKTCLFCASSIHAKQLCQKHYRRKLAFLRGKLISTASDFTLKEKIIAYSIQDPITKCMLWQKSLVSNGYGQISSKHTKETLAHRASYEAFNSVIPKDKIVCHHCDTPQCVNPSHLFLGSTQDNVDDRNNKNRQAKGTIFMRSNLTEHDVRSIRSSTDKLKLLAKKYGVSVALISQIRLHKKWRHVL